MDMIIYNKLSDDQDVEDVLEMCINNNAVNTSHLTNLLLKLSERYHLKDHLIKYLITILLTQNENSFTLTLERKEEITSSLKEAVLLDLTQIYNLFNQTYHFNNSVCEKLITAYTSSVPSTNIEVEEVIDRLYHSLCKCTDIESFYQTLVEHYLTYGVGKYGLNKAFRYKDGEIVPITNIDNCCFDDLIGYKHQKNQLIDNTDAFIKGKKANNVLLYGDNGTGKSSSIKALLNKYYKDGLRMVEVYKHQFINLPEIINQLQNRNYKFIIFMDDLSFEEFEIEYKYLKAVIEGGLEKKPNNILIYATSNRRHIIKETWKDRDTDEVNRNDAQQEKLSLVARFGVQILYTHPTKFEYLEIIDGLAHQYNLEVTEKMHADALTWEIRHGGFSGRTAKQFIHHYMSSLPD